MATSPKGLVYGFRQNYEICLFHLFRQNTPKNMFGNVLDRKLAFLDYRNNDFKKSKTLHFSKGVGPWFWREL